MIKYISLCILAISLLCACSKTKKAALPIEEGTYFSIRQFAQDQYDLYHGIPFTFMYIATFNGEKDSTIISIDSVDWGAIFKTFIETDISDQKYLGRYSFSTFEDDMTESRSLFYEAKEPGLLTQKLQISCNKYNNRVTHIYIETRKAAMGHARTQKLLYMPRKVIQIQEFESAAVGPSKELVAEYRFMSGLDE